MGHSKPPPDDVEPNQLWRDPEGQHFRVIDVSNGIAELQRSTPAGAYSIRASERTRRRTDAGNVDPHERLLKLRPGRDQPTTWFDVGAAPGRT